MRQSHTCELHIWFSYDLFRWISAEDGCEKGSCVCGRIIGSQNRMSIWEICCEVKWIFRNMADHWLFSPFVGDKANHWDPCWQAATAGGTSAHERYNRASVARPQPQERGAGDRVGQYRGGWGGGAGNETNTPQINNHRSKKQSHNIPKEEQGEMMYSSCSFTTSALHGLSGQRHAPAVFCSWGKDFRYLLYRKLGGPQSRSGHGG
jgi:hypothetical protein